MPEIFDVRHDEWQDKYCECCGQKTEYLAALDRGSVIIVNALLAAVVLKGKNYVHPEKEMLILARDWSLARAVEDGKLPHTYLVNLSKVRFHGLVMMVDGKTGNWGITSKGRDFLRDEPMRRYAVRSSAKNCTVGYLPEMCKASDLMRESDNWVVPGYEIEEGKLWPGPGENGRML